MSNTVSSEWAMLSSTKSQKKNIYIGLYYVPSSDKKSGNLTKRKNTLSSIRSNIIYLRKNKDKNVKIILMGDFNIHIGRICNVEYGDDGCIIGMHNKKYQGKMNNCSEDGMFLRKLVHELELPVQNGRTAENIHTTIDGKNYTYHEIRTDLKTQKVRDTFSEIDYIMGNVLF